MGGGPAGLAAAFYARLEGHAVKIFEALPKPGGMLRYGIPSYRLPRDLLDKEINVLWRMGVELQVNSRLGVDYQLEDLLDASYDAVFLALGAFNSNDMGIPGEDADGVVTAVDFLGELELNGEVHVGEKVTVIGGGFTAMDACRTAVRKGAAEVTCLYRRSRKEMPAHHTEVDEAEEEGVKLELLVRARARRSPTPPTRSPASRCSAWSSASPTPPAAAARCPSRAPSSSSSATRSSPPSASTPSSTAPARSRASSAPSGAPSRSTTGPSRPTTRACSPAATSCSARRP